MDFWPFVDFKQQWHSDGVSDPKSSNMSAFANDEVDRLAVALRLEFEDEARQDIARKVQHILQREQPYLFINAFEGIFAWQNKRADGDSANVDGWQYGFEHYHPCIA